ncbi:alpha-amylase 3, chloroplastic-like isoform X2 [Phoenix dactylifera]|uniref:1,4-alpha-D-glucan glucanohydrolase n=1 Tax=Phoenix dactylifera TaxID=42345 RepID=A0A8B8IYS3_PHODC|nr:alpha-amylase 3, chloroplastic-like isoform X2 [Phoenix dactylifera]
MLSCQASKATFCALTGAPKHFLFTDGFSRLGLGTFRKCLLNVCTDLEMCEYWRLSDQKGKPLGVVGWWPSHAVTFIENHDTVSTMGHWRFPSGKEMQGYAYILTHPGPPAVFHDHIFSHHQQEISRLISLRHQKKIHSKSMEWMPYIKIKTPLFIFRCLKLVKNDPLLYMDRIYKNNFLRPHILC